VLGDVAARGNNTGETRGEAVMNQVTRGNHEAGTGAGDGGTLPGHERGQVVTMNEVRESGNAGDEEASWCLQPGSLYPRAGRASA